MRIHPVQHQKLIIRSLKTRTKLGEKRKRQWVYVVHWIGVGGIVHEFHVLEPDVMDHWTAIVVSVK